MVPAPSSAVTVILTEFVPSVGAKVFEVTAEPFAVYSVTDAKLSVKVGTNVTDVTGLAIDAVYSSTSDANAGVNVISPVVVDA